ncbi:PEGA domain-containing protein [bacterium]|nr:PEGA domain-containing protein [bacterium]
MKGMITFPGAEIPGTVSDDVGKYVAELPAGNYVIHIYANGYRWLQRKISVEQGKKLKWDLTLKRKLGTVSGKAFDARTMAPLAATIKFAGTALPEIRADSLTGAFTAVLPPAKYAMTVSAPGYQPREFPFPLRDKQELDLPAALDPDVVTRPQPPAAPVTAPARPALTPAAPAPATPTDKVLTPKMPEFKPSIPELAPGS